MFLKKRSAGKHDTRVFISRSSCIEVLSYLQVFIVPLAAAVDFFCCLLSQVENRADITEKSRFWNNVLLTYRGEKRCQRYRNELTALR